MPNQGDRVRVKVDAKRAFVETLTAGAALTSVTTQHPTAPSRIPLTRYHPHPTATTRTRSGASRAATQRCLSYGHFGVVDEVVKGSLKVTSRESH